MRVGLAFCAPRCATSFNVRMNVGAFFGIFALMFVLELPDKTMIATMIMGTKARPLMVVHRRVDRSRRSRWASRSAPDRS